jgi:hypothetical protein
MGVSSACPPVKVRTVDGGYVQAQIWAHKKLDLKAGAGITRIHQLPEDRVQNWRQDPNNPGQLDPNTSVGYVTIKQQLGIGAGLTYHADDNFHVTVEYFRAVFEWWKPTPSNGCPTRRRRSTRSTPASPTTFSRSAPQARFATTDRICSWVPALRAGPTSHTRRVGAAVAKVAVDAGDRPRRQLTGAQRRHELGRRPRQRQTPANRVGDHGPDLVDRFGVEPRAAKVRFGRGGVTADAHRAQHVGRGVSWSRDEAHGAGDVRGDERRRDRETHRQRRAS